MPRPRYRAGKPAAAAPNRLQRQFTVALPAQAWVTDITYIRTYEGWLSALTDSTIIRRAFFDASLMAPITR